MSKKDKDQKAAAEVDQDSIAQPVTPPVEAETPEESAPAGDATKKDKALGSAKAVETMFRNAIRAELDIIALAATKANIMISLNGLIISALMISGAFIFASTVAFLLPAGVFMITTAASIVFALLAASPERVGLFSGLRDWVVDLFRGQARLSDLRTYLRRQNAGPADGDLNLLIYEHRATLTRADHWQRMKVLLNDREEIYRQMSDQLYWLGQMADRKFRLLDVSYTIFRWGLLVSVLTFISVKSLSGLFPGLSGKSVTRLHNLGIAEFTDIYEPSAVQQLADGRVLVVEDEASRAMSVMTLGEDGGLIENPANDLRITRAFGRKMNDLEGLSIDDEGYVYTVTSHSRNNDGQRRPDREQLLRFRILGNSVGEISSFTGLHDAITQDEGLRAGLAAMSDDQVSLDKLNIEGLSYYREAGHLLIGLREPMIEERSLILVITNPDAVFEREAAPRFGDPILLDLKGGGIRALSYDPVLRSFLIVNEIEGYEGNRYSQLWSWSGEPDAAPEPVALPDIINLNNVESIDAITIDGEPRLLLMSDEGNEKKNRPARYMMLKYDQIGG
ncbi:hypothetical protein SAMN04487972_1112 [Paracoccus halophilus]|uniref:Pycsar effector protein domain-containing protein n=1 Tax=Paracoccus halophilus TaxID=376733 RepID=A0A1I0TNW5_9RHOB|nr:Pycsar system effector family protein [Paracoccus halophilus]SFA53434.1 hypothetical protein SAMN04487972_1112 [Paracoccus halophilus]